jgi:hypothetical protein
MYPASSYFPAQSRGVYLMPVVEIFLYASDKSFRAIKLDSVPESVKLTVPAY